MMNYKQAHNKTVKLAQNALGPAKQRPDTYLGVSRMNI